jgi:hypothetical protein
MPPSPSPSKPPPNLNRARGLTSQAQGDALERYLLACAHPSRFVLTRVPVPVQILGPAPARAGRAADPRVKLARLEAAVAVDFQGTLKGGRALYLEAKTTRKETSVHRWVLPDRLRLPDAEHPDRGHQGRILLDAVDMGAASAVFLRCFDGPRAVDYLVPVGLEGSPALDAPSWSWEALEPYRVPAHGRWWDALA